MSPVIKIGLLVVVVTFAIFGLLVVMGVKVDAETLFVRGGAILGILFVSSVVIAYIGRPSDERGRE